MKRKLTLWVVLMVTLLVSQNLPAFQTKSDAKATTKTQASTAPSDKDIADAKAKGMVWVNTNTKVYHKDGQNYGKTKQGKFMTEDDAKKGGYRAAQEPGSKKKDTDTRKK